MTNRRRAALVRLQQIAPHAAVGVGLAHPLPQRFLVDPQVLGDVRDRTVRLEVETNRTLTQLVGVLPRYWPRRILSFRLDRARHRSLQLFQSFRQWPVEVAGRHDWFSRGTAPS